MKETFPVGAIFVSVLILAAQALAAGQTTAITYFVDHTGVPTLTNQPQLYRSHPEYREVRIPYAPVIVPGRFKFYESASRYSSRDIVFLVRRYAREYGIDENLIFAVIRAESNFDPYAISRAGARGLMQLMPATAAEMNITKLFDPAQNVAGGTQYLAKLLQHYKGDLDLSLAAYNAGLGTVQKFGGMPPYKETKAYVRRVKRFAQEFAEAGPSIQYMARGARPREAYLPQAPNSPYLVHFASGATQPAQNVIDRDTYYVVEYAGRRYIIRKSLVTKITKA